MTRIGGVLLTGGKSRRMGAPKATLQLPNGITVAQHLADALNTVTSWSVEIGPGFTSLDYRPDAQITPGPAVAAASGVKALLEHECTTGIVISCDLPRLSSLTLAQLLTIAGDKSLVARVDGAVQRSVFILSRSGMKSIHATAVKPGASLKDLLSRVHDLHVYESLSPQQENEITDCDTPEDWKATTGTDIPWRNLPRKSGKG